jgi:hypothetical protein
MTTSAQIKQVATQKGMTYATVTPGVFTEIEHLVVYLKPFVCAVFVMNNETFTFKYSHTTNAVTGKTTKRIPAGF